MTPEQIAEGQKQARDFKPQWVRLFTATDTSSRPKW